jgi:hypothetical protein
VAPLRVGLVEIGLRLSARLTLEAILAPMLLRRTRIDCQGLFAVGYANSLAKHAQRPNKLWISGADHAFAQSAPDHGSRLDILMACAPSFPAL